MAELLPHLNAALNAAASAFLISGWLAIRARREERHRALMLTAFGCSVLFLISYLVRHTLTGTHTYPGDGAEKVIYLLILASHVMLAAVVPFLALRTLYLAFRDRRSQHRRWARVTFPIWLYVSVTGVVVYWMLYHHAGVG